MEKPKETCHDGRLFPDGINPINYLLEGSMKNEHSYIHEHLMTLYFIAKEFNCKNIVEIGTGNGDSTIALGSAAYENGGSLISIDVDQCIEARSLIKDTPIEKNIAFLQLPVGYDLNMKFDLLFIDGDHSKDGVKNDIIKFLNQDLIDGCFVIFHDTNNPKWKFEINEAISETHLISRKTDKPRQQFFRNYHWFNCNGLLVLRYKEMKDVGW